MYRHIFHISKKVLGVIFIIFGVISFFLPIIPGFVFVILGLLMLGYERKSIHKFLNKTKMKLKRFFSFE